MSNELEKTTELYNAIRNNSLELIDNLLHIKDQLYIIEKDFSEFEVKVNVAIEGFDSLNKLFNDEIYFFELINKKEEISNILNTINLIIIEIINFNDYYDKNFNIKRTQLIEWITSISDLFNNIKHSFSHEEYFKEHLVDIANLVEKNNQILQENIEFESFNFYYVYKSEEYIRFIKESYSILSNIQQENIPTSQLMDIIDVLSKMPLEYNLNKLFK
jgi:hypothetical protein